MAESVVLVTEKREGSGSRLAERLRKQGKIPAVVYGHKEPTISVSVLNEELVSAIRHGARVVEIKLDDKVETAQMVEVQWDYLGKEVLHVDFKRVSADERIEVRVRVELRGIAPGINAGGSLDQPLHELHIECPALAVPDSIRVPILELQLDQAIHVRDLKLPEGVKVLDEPDAIVVQVTAPKTDAAAAAIPGEPGAATTAEPEVITARKKAEDEAEEKK